MKVRILEALRRWVSSCDANAEWDDLYFLVPALHVNFDKMALYSFYSEPASFEAFVPDGWTGKYENFLHLVPLEERYWIIDGDDRFATVFSKPL